MCTVCAAVLKRRAPIQDLSLREHWGWLFVDTRRALRTESQTKLRSTFACRWDAQILRAGAAVDPHGAGAPFEDRAGLVASSSLTAFRRGADPKSERKRT